MPGRSRHTVHKAAPLPPRGLSAVKRVVRVLPRLLIGNRDGASDLQLLQGAGVDSIVNIGGGRCVYPTQFEYYALPRVRDASDERVLHLLGPLTRWIHERLADGRVVLVHCRQGISRSAMVIAAYLIAFRSMDLESALETIRQARPAASPNAGFMAQLGEWHGLCIFLRAAADREVAGGGRRSTADVRSIGRTVTGHAPAPSSGVKESLQK
jgi:hypothetical protein